MVEFKIISVPLVEGVASTLKDTEVRGIYADEVERFVKDNFVLGAKWQERILDLLLNPIKTPADDGDLKGSIPYILTFMQEHIDGLNLITLQELRQAYEQNKQKTPFPNTYVETGLALIPHECYERNNYQANKLDSDFKTKGIDIGIGRVPNFAQLRVVPDEKSGLIFRLNETATRDNIPNLKDYKWNHVGKNDLFRAYLSSGSDWCADYGDLVDSSEDGRVVRYDAEGVAPKKLKSQVSSPDNIIKRLKDFRTN